MEKLQLQIVGLSTSVAQSHNFAVVLGELNGKRRLPIVIGAFEAQAIAVAMEDMVPSRPLTHDLFKSTLDTFEIAVREVVINNLQDGVFHARLVCESNGSIFEIDSRSSDAIAMAVRFDCPIYTYDEILESAAFEIEETESEEEVKPRRKPSSRRPKRSIRDMRLTDLKKTLKKVIEEEDYEKAAMIRDEIKRRSGKQSDEPSE